ncbi:DNA replication and repair protein RecO [Zeaxanthinibacter enoshimensis]|uniref:DNA repair protein RecO n=2 Tax=Zeaxanthinibacter enoshimensis TaxID=392009 RepID=A0A4R6TT52_9FLAO|nr:DNA replication and repair protein RecO [Zeaxanthinibacter enoshimensis]
MHKAGDSRPFLCMVFVYICLSDPKTMQVTTKAIVLSSLKYGDSSLIVKAFTESDGLKTYLLKGVLSSRKAKIKAAYFQPLMQLEIVAYHKNKGTLEHLKEVHVAYPYESLHTRMDKSAICQFLAEVLVHSLQEEEENVPLFNYLQASLQWLDTHEQAANFHLLFLLELSRYLGFYPDTTADEYPYFDLVEGLFLRDATGNLLLSGDELSHFKALLGINFDALPEIKLTKTERKDLLQILLQYFEIHLHGFRKPKSLAILNEVFS